MDFINRCNLTLLELLDELGALDVECGWIDIVVTSIAIMAAKWLECASHATLFVELAVAAFSLDKVALLDVLVTLALSRSRSGVTAFVHGLENTCKSTFSKQNFLKFCPEVLNLFASLCSILFETLFVSGHDQRLLELEFLLGLFPALAHLFLELKVDSAYNDVVAGSSIDANRLVFLLSKHQRNFLGLVYLFEKTALFGRDIVRELTFFVVAPDVEPVEHLFLGSFSLRVANK